MGRTAPPTTLMFCCPLPAGMSSAHVGGCLDATSHAMIPVTWIAGVESMPLLAERRTDTVRGPMAAIDVPAEAVASRQSFRRLLATATSAAGAIDTALIRGPLPQDCRRMLVDAGISVVVRDGLESVSRGARRPAPAGWPCRSVLWGLWEVTASDGGPPGMIGRLLPWGAGDRLRPGGLAVVDLAGSSPTPGSIRDRLDRWQAWARREGSGAVEIAPLSALPDLISGAARRHLTGSVLKAA